ncbi:uncharacterized protein LOC123666208 [Melitaea cinxia]|uniref:uncharacterized protein LOC123666208 n=1 Tax=Melitaea cinxia TaxID=113334 RepID=UPI001E270365|nr:uncharacterized protein LOC123666208 [Melitaea cinxia]
MAQKRCCVRDCFAARADNVILHSFPNPDTDAERFRTWCFAIGGNVLVLDDQFIHANRKVCHKHFETKYHTRSSRLSANAVPTLQLKPAVSSRERHMSDITNIISNNSTSAELSTGPSAVEPSSTIDYRIFAKASTSKKKKLILLCRNMSASESVSKTENCKDQ